MFTVLFIGLFFLITPPCLSADFTISQNLTYEVKNNGQASVTQIVELVNNLSQVYPQNYQIDISGFKISNLQAYDNIGNIIKSSTDTDNHTSLKLSFNRPNIGKNQKNSFTVTYIIKDFAINKGNTWEITLPRYHSDTNTGITLLVPTSFGHLSFSSVKPADTDNLDQTQQLHLRLPPNYPSRVLLIFGNYQLFDFDLTYYLVNHNDQVIKTEIALPPDTGSQKITYRSIDPEPLTITQDSDGNWLAQYQLNPRQQLYVSAGGQAKITSPLPDYQPPPGNSLTQEQDFWPVNQPIIKSISQSLKTPRQIYDYVVGKLDYNYNLTGNLKRRGAAKALSLPKESLCTEFTDLFVTLSRASGIPAREIEGFAYSNNSKIKPISTNTDILHAWPQYYDTNRQTWRSVDPTWAKTSGGIDYFSDLDLNHLAFVIHGTQSDYPPPPGSFRPNQNTKTVSVNFAQDEVSPKLTPLKTWIQYHPPKTASLIITNPNLTSVNQLTININQLEFHTQILKLPPLGKTEIPLPSIRFLNSIHPKNQKITISLQASEFTTPELATTPYRPHLLNLLTVITILIILLVFGGIILTVSSSIRL